MSSKQLMKRRLNPFCNSLLWSVMLPPLLVLSSGCSGNLSDKNVDSSSNNSQSQTLTNASSSDINVAIVRDFAQQVIIPTYKQLVGKAEKLSQSIDIFISNPSEETLKAAQNDWLAARFPWEQSEAFAFGPADSLGYDGDLDDWPVNEIDVQAVIESNDELTPEYIANLQTTQKGFHTIELLLFGVDSKKKATDFSQRELEYLKALTIAFNQTANELVKSWVEGVKGNPPYQEVLATAGDKDNVAYPTVGAAVEEIVQGMIGCLDEVANEKIGEPLETKNTEGLESRFSHSSLNDFNNNLHSVKNAYLGEVPDARTKGKSLSLLVAQVNPKLDEQIKGEMQAALDALEAIPAPIEDKITDEEALAKMKTAKKAILTLFSTIEKKLLPLVQEGITS